jgi:hypothetical protein
MQDRAAQPKEDSLSRNGQALDVKAIVLAGNGEERRQMLSALSALVNSLPLTFAAQLRRGVLSFRFAPLPSPMCRSPGASQWGCGPAG